jgi:crotonobetainyl-CoA:carnitine CoA-transferase CaiB-like acyl-CoA transferase
MIFQNLKVVELSSVLAGPGVGQFFAELGATVIKVENSKVGGDVTRSWKLPGDRNDDRSAYFCSVNWGKKSVSVDLTTTSGLSIVHKFIRQADIVITSYKPGDAEKLGVAWSQVKPMNEKLIYGQITGYGSGVDRVGYDAVIQAESGWMSMNGEPGAHPLKLPIALVDVIAGHQLKEALLVALLQRERTGKGAFVEVSLIHAALASLVNQGSNWLVAGHLPVPQGSAHPNIAPYGEVYTTNDGWKVMLAVGTDPQFSDLCEVLGLSLGEFADDFTSNQKRVINRASLNSILSSAVGLKKGIELIAALNAKKIPAGVVHNVKEAIEGPGSGMLLEQGPLRGLRSFIARNESGWLGVGTLSSPPPFGAHNSEESALF